MDKDVDVGIPVAGLGYLVYRESGVDRAVALPQDDLGVGELLLGVAAHLLERVPQNHLIDADPHLEAGVSSEMLVRQEEDAAAPFEVPTRKWT